MKERTYWAVIGELLLWAYRVEKLGELEVLFFWNILIRPSMHVVIHL